MRSQQAGLEWLYFDGGPMVFLPSELLKDWKGYLTAPATLPADSRSSDYDRACKINDFIGAIRVGSGQGIVVSVENAQAAWKPVSQEEGMIVEWGYADGEKGVARTLDNLPKHIWSGTGIVLHLPGGRATLIWAACVGNQLSGSSGEDHLEVRLTPGAYEVSTADYKPDPRTWLLLHRFVRVTPTP